jgi:YrbI family 3-deoxy-D-manno-octulosonate 8-phosphate phosphatase|tara:strand:+ start:142 stop:612 length:471 start_codon:yes stop_codon:yes gene_type:complete
MVDIQLIVYDFDGVMTDNKVFVDQNCNELVQVNRADGLGVAEIKKLGIEQMIISTEKNPVVSARASKLNIPCLQGIDNKKKALMDYCHKNNVELNNVAYVGNDINDIEAMKMAGITFCPADSHDRIKEISQYILETKGGQGVVRELLDFINQQKGV